MMYIDDQYQAGPVLGGQVRTRKRQSLKTCCAGLRSYDIAMCIVPVVCYAGEDVAAPERGTNIA